MKIKQALQNPFVLVAQGFVVGAFIFFSTAPGESVRGDGERVESAALAEKLGA